MGRAELRFRAMGTDCHVLVLADGSGAEELAGLARTRVDLLEQCWSRFREDSELSHLNASAGGGPRPASADLLLLATRMREAWHLSGGLFDPTVLESVRSLGYDADFATVTSRPASTITDVLVASAPGMTGVLIDEGTISLPAGVGLDPGAIGKGLAADTIADDLVAAGADGVLVNLGGDIALAGVDDSPWAVGVEDERLPVSDTDRLLRVLEFPEGTERAGVATSTTLKRRWAQGRRHHVIDPRTGAMSTSDLVQATVVAGTAWEAEVTATTALLLDSRAAQAWLREHGVTGILLTENDLLHTDEENHG